VAADIGRPFVFEGVLMREFTDRKVVNDDAVVLLAFG
jgi:hypothetical protein